MDAAKSSSLTTGHEFWVLAVERYLLGEARVYRYDVTLCGGALNTWAPLKCLLAPHLNHLVQRKDLRAGCRLRVAQLWVQVSKLTISHLSCVAAGFVNIEAIDFAGLRIITLKELVFAWRRRLKLAPLLVRIMCKSRLQHYGKTAKYIDWPYQACFKVADSSGMMSVILWNSLCPKLFRSLEVGTVILMQQYSVKVAHHKRNHPILYYPDMKIYNEIDIYLNPWKPTSDIKVIPSKQIKPEWKLPDIKYRFITRDKLDIVPNSYICDVIGLVTFVGRCERIRKSEDSDDFWVRRFIEMVDETSAKPFILELYCTSQPEIYRQLHPVTFLVCTQMRVVRNKFNSITYLTSSHETQIYITGYHKGRPYRTDNTVKRFLNWAKLQNEKDFLESSLVGGYYSFPPLPSSFLTYIQNMKAINLTTMCQLKEKIEGLYYREHKHIVIEGIITAVRYITPAFSIGCSVYKKYTQLANTKNGANVQSSNSSTEYQDYLANNQVSEQDYFCNFHRTFQTSNQIFESKEEVTSLGRKKYNLRSRKEELFQSSILKSNSPDPDLLSSNEETEDEYFTADEDHPGMEYIAKSKPVVCSWESSKWSEIKGHLKEFLSFGQLLPQSCPQKFEYAKKEAIMSQHNLHPSRCDSYLLDSINSAGKFTNVLVHCYYTVTIVDLNREIAMDVVFLPLGNDKTFSNSARNCNFISILSGDCTSGTPIINGSEIEGKNFIFILDVYHHGNDQTEIILNRAYKTE